MNRSRRGLLGLPLALAMKHPIAQAAQQATGLTELPANLPVPKDDGGARHLKGMALPDLELPSTANRRVNLSKIGPPRIVVYAYPMTGQPGKTLPAGWDDIPGARGCTPESCGFRDHAAELAQLGASVAGLSVQPLEEQVEFAQRTRMPFPVIADPNRELGRALDLPTFEFEGLTLYKRVTIVAEAATIVKVFYPVFPPDKNAEEVVQWLRSSQ